MQKFLSRLLLVLAPCAAVFPLHVAAAKLLDARVNVQQEKHNALVHFSNAAISTFGVPSSSELNAFVGVTPDFGGTLPAFVVFKKGLPDGQATKYAEHQGKNHGEAQCDLVQKGNSPMAPEIPVAVLAQNCTILSVAY